jgi:hypothetical protein
VSIQAVGWVLDHEKTTTGSDRLVLISLANHANASFESWPRIETIAAETNVARVRTVQDALTRLERAGLIVRVLNGAPDQRVRADRRANLYRIVVDGVSQNVIPSDATGCRLATERGVVSRRDGVSLSDADRELALISLEPSVEPSVEPRVVVSIDELFDAFWKSYPRKTAKRGAASAFVKAIRRAEPETIIEGARRYADDPNRDSTFTAHPASWLNDDRWLDEALPPRTKTTKNASQRDRLVVTDRSLPSGRITL